MKDEEKFQFNRSLIELSQSYGHQTVDKSALMHYWSALSKFPTDRILSAMADLRETSKWFPSISEIATRCRPLPGDDRADLLWPCPCCQVKHPPGSPRCDCELSAVSRIGVFSYLHNLCYACWSCTSADCPKRCQCAGGKTLFFKSEIGLEIIAAAKGLAKNQSQKETTDAR